MINFNTATRAKSDAFYADVFVALRTMDISPIDAANALNEYADDAPEIEYRTPEQVARDIIHERN